MDIRKYGISDEMSVLEKHACLSKAKKIILQRLNNINISEGAEEALEMELEELEEYMFDLVNEEISLDDIVIEVRNLSQTSVSSVKDDIDNAKATASKVYDELSAHVNVGTITLEETVNALKTAVMCKDTGLFNWASIIGAMCFDHIESLHVLASVYMDTESGLSDMSMAYYLLKKAEVLSDPDSTKEEKAQFYGGYGKTSFDRMMDELRGITFDGSNDKYAELKLMKNLIGMHELRKADKTIDLFYAVTAERKWEAYFNYLLDNKSSADAVIFALDKYHEFTEIMANTDIVDTLPDMAPVRADEYINTMTKCIDEFESITGCRVTSYASKMKAGDLSPEVKDQQNRLDDLKDIIYALLQKMYGDFGFAEEAVSTMFLLRLGGFAAITDAYENKPLPTKNMIELAHEAVGFMTDKPGNINKYFINYFFIVAGWVWKTAKSVDRSVIDAIAAALDDVELIAYDETQQMMASKYKEFILQAAGQ